MILYYPADSAVPQVGEVAEHGAFESGSLVVVEPPCLDSRGWWEVVYSCNWEAIVE